MQIKSAKMIQWPPSPSVEDEVTALANEHAIDDSVESLKSDNQPALSRGSIDQYPIIIDTAEVKEAEEVNHRQRWTKDLKAASDVSSSEDSAGPPTPPPLLKKTERKADQGSSLTPPRGGHAAGGLQRASSADNRVPIRGRPQVTRIQTDVGGDMRGVGIGSRQQSSPYAFSRSSVSHDQGTGYPPSTDNFLSPSHAFASPEAIGQQPRQLHVLPGGGLGRSQAQPPSLRTPVIERSRPENERMLDQQSRRAVRYPGIDSRLQPELMPPRSGAAGNVRRPSHETMQRVDIESPAISPLHSRRQSREIPSGSTSEGRNSLYQAPPSRRSTAGARESSDGSSGEQGSSGRSRRGSGSGQRKLRRRSSHRAVRPSSAEFRPDPRSESVPASAIDGPGAGYYQRNSRGPEDPHLLTPMTADVSKAAMEDYFAKAFDENKSRKAKPPYTPGSSGSALASPMTTPPRTPRMERQGNDYFDLTPTTQKPPQWPRAPSMDERQMVDARNHSNLLSVATAGAAIAARAPVNASRSPGPPTETTMSPQCSKPANVPRSRKSSPVQGDPNEATRIAVLGTAVPAHNPKGPYPPIYDPRPVSRGTINGPDSTIIHPPPHPPVHTQRTFSTGVIETSVPRGGSSTLPPADLAYNAASPMSAHPSRVPAQHTARPSLNTVNPSPIVNAFGLPICPRSKPVVGFQDWYTIKEHSEIDICPTCMSVLGNTRYRNLFVPSLPRPYNEPSVCAMSMPWVRIAFLQSIRQNRPDLSAIRAVTSLPRGTKSCPGNKDDIRSWFHVIDPKSNQPVPDFFACAACVRAIDHVFPDLQTMFERPKSRLNAERSCNLHVGGKHFQSIIDHLEHASARVNGRRYRSADVEQLIRHIWRISRYKPCSRDAMLSTRTWHFMPDLPEFTICEECYEQVVWPLNDRSVARDICKSLKIVPLRRGSNGTTGISCQLYSERMRKAFLEAVDARDLTELRNIVKTRVSAQQRLTEINKLYEQDLGLGIDRRAEIHRNHEIWRGFE